MRLFFFYFFVGYKWSTILGKKKNVMFLSWPFLFLCTRLLGFHRIPPVVGRLINVTSEIREITTDHKLSRTFFTSPGVCVCVSLCIHACNGNIETNVQNYVSWPFYSLTPPSWKCVFLRPLWLLLFTRAPTVRSARHAGGLPGCHATRSHPGSPQVVEVTMEALLQPHQAGGVGSNTGFPCHILGLTVYIFIIGLHAVHSHLNSLWWLECSKRLHFWNFGLN